MFRIKNKEGKYFKKVKSSQFQLKDGKYYKETEWDNKGKVFMDEEELNRALKKLTTITLVLRGAHKAYPTYSMEDLIIEKV